MFASRALLCVQEALRWYMEAQELSQAAPKLQRKITAIRTELENEAVLATAPDEWGFRLNSTSNCVQVCRSGARKHILRLIGTLQLGKQFALPRAVYEKLFTYQREGVAWLYRTAWEGSQWGGILADDMGLGKSVQVRTARPSVSSAHLLVLRLRRFCAEVSREDWRSAQWWWAPCPFCRTGKRR